MNRAQGRGKREKGDGQVTKKDKKTIQKKACREKKIMGKQREKSIIIYINDEHKIGSDLA